MMAFVLPRSPRTVFAVAVLMGVLAGCSGGDEYHEPAQRQAIEQRLDATAQAALARNTAWPGLAAHVIAQDGTLTWQTALGFADTATRRPLTADATFRIASVTKTFTAAAIYRLMEMNRLDVSDPIERHLQPASVDVLRQAGYDTRTITLDHLLAHTAGLRDFALSQEYLTAVLANPVHRWSRAEQLALAMALGAPLGAPGAAYSYSDTGYILLGEIVETRTGLALGAAFRALLKLDELGLRATWQESIEPVPAGAGERARQYFAPNVDATPLDASIDLWGGGGLASNTRDLAVFMRALLEGRVLGPAALARMQEIAAPAASLAPAPARGLFRVRVRDDACWGHDGFWGAVVIHCVDRGVTVAATIDLSPLGYAPTDEDPFALAAQLAASAMAP